MKPDERSTAAASTFDGPRTALDLSASGNEAEAAGLDDGRRGPNGFRVMTLTVPPKASAPKIDEPGPWRISIRSTASSGTGMSPL